MKLLEDGSGTMGVWLGKQILGQRDVVTNEHIGAAGGAIQVAVRPDLARLSQEELLQLRELTRKALPGAERFQADLGPTSEVTRQ